MVIRVAASIVAATPRGLGLGRQHQLLDLELADGGSSAAGPGPGPGPGPGLNTRERAQHGVCCGHQRARRPARGERGQQPAETKERVVTARWQRAVATEADGCQAQRVRGLVANATGHDHATVGERQAATATLLDSAVDTQVGALAHEP